MNSAQTLKSCISIRVIKVCSCLQVGDLLHATTNLLNVGQVTITGVTIKKYRTTIDDGELDYQWVVQSNHHNH